MIIWPALDDRSLDELLELRELLRQEIARRKSRVHRYKKLGQPDPVYPHDRV